MTNALMTTLITARLISTLLVAMVLITNVPTATGSSAGCHFPLLEGCEQAPKQRGARGLQVAPKMKRESGNVLLIDSFYLFEMLRDRWREILGSTAECRDEKEGYSVQSSEMGRISRHKNS